MYSWFYYPAEEYEQAEKTLLFYLDKKCRILAEPNLTDGEKKIKIDRIDFVCNAIRCKYGINKI